MTKLKGHVDNRTTPLCQEKCLGVYIVLKVSKTSDKSVEIAELF